MQLETTINPRKVGLILCIIAVYFATQSLVVEYVQDQVSDSDVSPSFILAIDLFSVNAEQTIPTWYSATNLLLASVLLWLISAAKRADHDRYWPYWVGLAVGFLYLSVDEGAVIHEVLADWMQKEFDLSGYLAFAWQIVAAPLVILVAILYLRFLFHLPPQTRNRFLAAGVLYVTGTLLLDAVSANKWDEAGITFGYLAIGTLEELSEMLGVILLIYALLSYMVEMRYTFVFGSPPLAQHMPVMPASAPMRQLLGELRSFFSRRLVIAAIMLILAANLALLYWASAQESVSRSAASNSAVSLPIIIDQIVTDEVVVARMPGRFIDNPAAHQVIASLLALYDDVIVVTSVSTESSFALAADKLPFDRNRLTDILHANGEVQFVIFDSPAVKAIVGNTPIVSQDQ